VPTTRATTPDPSIEDDCRQSLIRLQPVQGQQGQIQQVDDAVAVVVAGEDAVVAGIGGAVVIHVGTAVVEALAPVAAEGHTIAVRIRAVVIKPKAGIDVVSKG